ncbi:hypothetical protein MATL_G00134970 [Megalops atlanticus]|uniref:Uncharacterized protein n=1 Tax=Megalops atlanticus TaxID=7932 RepID=A0A9D3T502_MEGAT|nr:hypothetical protein MATL_G00134970 [Megalops atlanticus]
MRGWQGEGYTAGCGGVRHRDVRSHHLPNTGTQKLQLTDFWQQESGKRHAPTRTLEERGSLTPWKCSRRHI